MIKTCKFIFILLFTISVNITNIYNINATQEDEKHFHFMFQDGFHHSSNIFLGFEQSSFMFDTPLAHSILKWNDMQGFQTGFEFYAGYSKIRGYFKYTFSQLKGTGTDDDMANSDINGFAAFSTHNAKGSSHDLRFGILKVIFLKTQQV